MRVMVFEKPACSKCRELAALLRERGVEYDTVDFHVVGITEAQLRDIVRLAGVAPWDLLRTGEPVVAELGLDDPAMADEERIRLMSEHPQVVQRPIVVAGDRAVVARPPERVLELLPG